MQVCQHFSVECLHAYICCLTLHIVFAGMPGFDELVFSLMIPTCLQVVLNPEFDPEDAWVGVVHAEYP